MSTLNQEAPPAVATKGDFVRFKPFPSSDSLVLTLVAVNFLPQHPFKRKDKETGVEKIVPQDAVELYFGTLIDEAAYFVKSWEQAYSIHEKSNYTAAYTALTGKAPVAGSKPSDMVGKYALVSIDVSEKTSRKGKKYTATSIESITKVPKQLATTGVPIDQLRPALEAALKGEGAKDDGVPF